MTIRTAFILACGIFLAASQARAESSVGTDLTTGAGYRGFDVKASADFDAKGTWWTNLLYSHARDNDGSTPSRTNLWSAEIDHDIDDSWEARGGLTGSKDAISTVRYVGPSAGFTYTWNGADQDAPPVLDVVADADLLFYQTDANLSSSTIHVGRRTIHRPARMAAVKTNQLHPNLKIDKPLLGGDFKPYLSAGYYFYSNDPNNIEQLVGRPRFAPSAGNLTSMTGGFMRENLEAGSDAVLPAAVGLHAALAVQRLATDNSWGTVQDVSLKRTFADRFKLSLDWTRTIQDGARQDLYTAGLSLLFSEFSLSSLGG